MAVEITMTGAEAEEELRALHRWLLDEPGIRRRARISLRAAPVADGEMGSAVDAIQLVFTDAMQLAGLVLAFVTWRGTRRAKPTVTIEHDGTKVTLDGASTETVEDIVRLLRSETT